MKSKRIAFAASAAALSLVLVGCGAGSGGSAASDGDLVTVNAGEPQNPLLPGVTNETGGGRILNVINARLVYYTADGKPKNDLAESIKQNSNSTEFTIKVKKGMKFSDGSDLNAHSFVDAWNYMANPKNAQAQGFFLEDVKGYEPGPEKGKEGEAKDILALEGLKILDDHTFKVELNQPASDFALRLGYSAFAPLPKKAFEDMKAYGEKPLSSGPYKLADDGWRHNEYIKVVANDKYNGPQKAKNKGINFKIYTKQDAAYQDLLGGQLDAVDNIPDSAFGSYKKDLGDRAVNQPAAIFQSFTIPVSTPHFGVDDEGRLRRQALSMSIDRKQITDKVFQGTRTPAKDFTSPAIDGWSDKIPGSEVTNFDAAKAKDLWAKANAIKPWDGKFQIAYNADGGHQAWVDAVCNQIKNTLGIDAEGKPYPDFKSFRDDITNQKLKAGFRTGWQADYPGMYNFLGPTYATGGPSNDGQYTNPTFDKLLREGNAAPDVKTANAKYIEAQQILLKDLPAIPLWYSNVNGGSAESVSGVKFGWDGQPLYHEIEKK
ncbi:MAG: ABC transporter substrate-binding protein [Actinomycetaceae bacterium]|nr:ABC transporter substrate-binding protein [Actinomycetaceae bacterium]